MLSHSYNKLLLLLLVEKEGKKAELLLQKKKSISLVVLDPNIVCKSVFLNSFSHCLHIPFNILNKKNIPKSIVQIEETIRKRGVRNENKTLL